MAPSRACGWPPGELVAATLGAKAGTTPFHPACTARATGDSAGTLTIKAMNTLRPDSGTKRWQGTQHRFHPAHHVFS